MLPFAIARELFNIDSDVSSRLSQDQQQRFLEMLLRSQGQRVGGMGISAPTAIGLSTMMKSPSLSTVILQRQYEIDQQKRRAAQVFECRDQSLASQQRQQQDLMLKRAILERTAMETNAADPHNNLRRHVNHRRCSNSMYCAEQDLSPQKDICFGRGQRVQRRQANIAFRKIVAEYQEMYDQAESREGKKNVVLQVSRSFANKGYRFFKESEEGLSSGRGSKIWIVVPNSDVEYKIGHSFRSGRKILKREYRNRQKLNNKEKQGRVCKATTNGGERVKIVPNDHDKSKEDDFHKHCLNVNDSSELDVSVGEKRVQSTNMNTSNYDYFRQFVGSFKSLYDISKSPAEKEKIVSSIIQQVKDQKGHRFNITRSSQSPPLTPLQTDDSRYDDGLKVVNDSDVEGWVEAPTIDLVNEVRSILGDEIQGKPSELSSNRLSVKTKRLTSNALQNERKRGSDSSISNYKDTENDKPQKRRCLSPGKEKPGLIGSTTKSFPPTTEMKRVVSDSNASSNSVLSSDLNPAQNSCHDESASSMREKIPVSLSLRLPVSITSNTANALALKQGLIAPAAIDRGVHNVCERAGRAGTSPLEKDTSSLCNTNNNGGTQVPKENHIARYLRERDLITRVAKERKELAELRRPGDSSFDIDSTYLEGLTLKNERGLCLTDYETSWLEKMEQDQRAALLRQGDRRDSVARGDPLSDLECLSLGQQIARARLEAALHSTNGWRINTAVNGTAYIPVDRFAMETDLIKLQRLEQRDMEQKQLMAIIDMQMRSIPYY